MIACAETPFGSAEYLKALVVRHSQLRAPLGLNYTPQELSIEGDYRHFIALENGDVVGNVSLAARENGFAQIKQVAVDTSCQGKGIGRALIDFAEQQARAAGFTYVFLNARASTVPFYGKLGYEGEGEFFALVGTPHQRMTKRL